MDRSSLRARRFVGTRAMQAGTGVSSPAVSACGPELFDHTFSARLPSADPGLFFDAVIGYRWWREDEAPEGSGARGRAAPLHPDAVARSLLRSRCGAATAEHGVLDPAAAEDAANRSLSAEARHGALLVAGHARLAVDAENSAHARARAADVARARTVETSETARIEAVRDRLLTPGTGLLWWLEAHGVLGSAGDTDVVRVRRLAEAFEKVTADLQSHSRGRPESTPEAALTTLRAHFEDVIAVLQNPEHVQHAIRALEQVTGVMGTPVRLDQGAAERRGEK